MKFRGFPSKQRRFVIHSRMRGRGDQDKSYEMLMRGEGGKGNSYQCGGSEQNFTTMVY